MSGGCKVPRCISAPNYGIQGLFQGGNWLPPGYGFNTEEIGLTLLAQGAYKGGLFNVIFMLTVCDLNVHDGKSMPSRNGLLLCAIQVNLVNRRQVRSKVTIKDSVGDKSTGAAKGESWRARGSRG